MKVSIGMKLTTGSWGGGNQLSRSLKSFLERKGCKVCRDLNEQDIDSILLTEPRVDLCDLPDNIVQLMWEYFEFTA